MPRIDCSEDKFLEFCHKWLERRDVSKIQGRDAYGQAIMVMLTNDPDILHIPMTTKRLDQWKRMACYQGFNSIADWAIETLDDFCRDRLDD